LFVLAKPLGRRRERAGNEAAHPNAALLASRDQPDPFQRAHVLEHRGEGDPVRRRELTHTRFPVREAIQHGPPDGIGERSEGVVERRRIVNHWVKYW
jgi:hypothetical protein